MNSGESVNVYAEAKSEYTRQLCQILTPSLQLYFLDVLKSIKEKDEDARRLLWNFQAFLQEIPDWNQDKVIRETEKIQRESNCDYLEELLTAVFIAHTKVLSAIRITAKQKKLQLTIPKIDHFLHRTLRETGRILWGNAFLFAEQGTPIERQKNMRQVEGLIMEGIQQSIRSLLPVKTILKEYLNDEDDDEDEEKPIEEKPTEAVAEPVAEESAAVEETPKAPQPIATLPEPIPVIKLEEKITETVPETVALPVLETPKMSNTVNIIKEEPVAVPAPAPAPSVQEEVGPTIHVETVPSVSFTNMDTIFDSDHPEANEIAESNVGEGTYEEVEHVEVLNQPPEPMDDFEDLESSGGFEFEEIQA